MDFADFMEYAADTIGRYFVTVNNADLPLASSFYEKDDDDYSVPGYVREGAFVTRDVVRSMEISELIDEVGLITDNDELNNDIEACFNDAEQWINKDPLSITTEEEDALDWEQFCNTIKHRRRFSIEEEIIPENYYGYKKSISDIIDRIFSVIKQNKCLMTLYKGARLYRGRPFISGEPKEFNDLTSPPDNCAKQNRMSPAGISMFYGALDSKTSVTEIGKFEGRLFVGRFTTTKDLKLIDLTNLPHPSYWVSTDFGDMAFLKNFSREVSKEIKRDDRIHIEYLPTQAFTEYVRYRFLEDGKHIDGIIYNSSICKGGKNVVLFCNQKESGNLIELTDFKEYVRPYDTYATPRVYVKNTFERHSP